MSTLAERLGTNCHVSPLRRKVVGLSRTFNLPDATCPEDWLMAVAFERGFRVVRRPGPAGGMVEVPDLSELSNEELVVAFCQSECRDEPQMLRIPAQIISRKILDIDDLLFAARRERTCRVLAELARQAIRVDPAHAHWGLIRQRLSAEKSLSSPLLHWSRLAEPVMIDGRCNAEKWVLVA